MQSRAIPQHQRLWIISDLHLEDSSDGLLSQLITTLDSKLLPGDAVVFAGDIFDSFFGPKSVYFESYRTWVEWCRKLVNSHAVYFIEGNHDFQLQDGFAQKIPGLRWSEREFEFLIQGTRVYVAHGDLANQADHGYLCLRWFFRSPLMRAFIKFAPDTWIDWIGKNASGASRSLHHYLPENFEPARLKQLRLIYHQFAKTKFSEGFSRVILGHCHDLDQFEQSVDGRDYQYLNMGFPPRHQSIVLIDKTAQRVALDKNS